jgi:hypothetical protein
VLPVAPITAIIGSSLQIKGCCKGYPVAVVVADTLDIARDAAERVAVDYAPRPAVVVGRCGMSAFSSYILGYRSLVVQYSCHLVSAEEIATNFAARVRAGWYPQLLAAAESITGPRQAEPPRNPT